MHSSRHVVNGGIPLGILTCEPFWCTPLRKTVALRFVTLRSHVMKTALSAAGLQRSLSSLPTAAGTRVPPVGLINVAAPVRNAWSRISSARARTHTHTHAHTLGITQQCSRVMAHDTVSVVAKHPGPPSQMNRVHTFVQVPKSVVHTHTHTHTHIHTFFIPSPEEALHMKQETWLKWGSWADTGQLHLLVFIYRKDRKLLRCCEHWSVVTHFQ